MFQTTIIKVQVPVATPCGRDYHLHLWASDPPGYFFKQPVDHGLSTLTRLPFGFYFNQPTCGVSPTHPHPSHLWKCSFNKTVDSLPHLFTPPSPPSLTSSPLGVPSTEELTLFQPLIYLPLGSRLTQSLFNESQRKSTEVNEGNKSQRKSTKVNESQQVLT